MIRKISCNGKILIILSIFIYVCLQIGLIQINKYYLNQSYNKETINTQPVGEIIKGTEIIQELPKFGEIYNIDILFATYARDITSSIKVEINQKDNKEVFSKVINAKEVKDNQYYSIPVNIKVNNSDMPLYLKIEGIDGTSGNALTIWSSDIQNKGNDCYVNNKEINKTLNIKVNTNNLDASKINKLSKLITIAFLGIFILLILNFIEKTGKLKEIYKYRYWIIGVIFIISVFILKINFSSFQTFEGILPNNVNVAKEIQLGVYRGIRSDEWGVLTPLQLSQDGNNYNNKSDLLGENSGVSVISGGIPTKDLSIIGKPFLWGFILFGAEIGFSWYSVTKILLLLIFSYKLICILTQNRKLATLGSIVIGFSPGIQWWFTTNAQCTESIICWEMIIVSMYNIFSNKLSRIKYFYGAILLVGTIGFTLALYPPLQVPLFYLGILLLIGLYLDNKKDIVFSKQNFAILGGIIVGYAFIMFITLSNILPEIQKIMNTVYPGKRSVTGGALTLEYLFNYIPTILLPFKEIPYSNSSEISSFITLFPFPLVVYFANRDIYNSNVIKCIVLFILGSLEFMYVGLPQFIAKITLMNFTTEKRLFVIFGFACTLLVMCMLNYNKKSENKKIPLGQIVLYLVIWYYAYRNFGNLIGYMGKIIFIVVLAMFSALIYYFNINKDRFIKLLLLITILVGITINPINFGIEEIRGTQFSSAVRQINKEDSGMWMTIDDLWISKYILAQGVQILNALNYPPMLQTWGSLDKNNEFSDVYNRYAHVKVNLQENSEAKFNLIQPDVFEVNMSIEQVTKLGVKYIVTKQELDKNIGNVSLIYVDTFDRIYIYKII